MKNFNMPEKINNLKKSAKKNSPEILTCIVVVGTISTLALSLKAGPKAHEILERKKEDWNDISPDDKQTKRKVILETAKELTPVLLPPVSASAITIVCAIGENRINAKRVAALSTAYTVTSEAYKAYKDHVRTVVGERKNQAIAEYRARKSVEEDKAPEDIKIIDNGDILCKDSFSQRYFKSSHAKITDAILQLSADCASDMYVSLNDFYDAIDPTHTYLERLPQGDDMGWNAEDLCRGKLPITITATMGMNNTPCLFLDYDVVLRTDYRNLY